MTDRQRSNKKTKGRKKNTEAKDKNKRKDVKNGEVTGDPKAEQDETAWDVVMNHPLIQVLYRMLPFLCGLAMYHLNSYVRLQCPGLLSGLMQLRPAISETDSRQLLIVGAMSSGTKQVAADLNKHLALEVGHEEQDASWNFVRDGTVSWFHGLRFLPAPEGEEKAQAYRKICLGNYTNNMGFHPRMYRASRYGCSSRVTWDQCWARECIAIVDEEWGCAAKETCSPSFEKNLLQVRNPLETIESLVAKFCQGGLTGTVHPSFLQMLSGIFPSQKDLDSYSCIEAASYFVVNWNNALLNAHEKGLIDSWYKVEETSVCEVARLAGFMDIETTIYEPNVHKIQTICEKGEVNDPMSNEEHRINEDLVALKWDDLKGGVHGSKRAKTDEEILLSVRGLFTAFGYDPNAHNEAEFEDVFPEF
uniref:Uncharacterized protein n=1 Tax=Asterionellopsis glacialis TaxID=33640 RepID=A0A7S0KXK3_9STRA|mmetsp:Transcript_1890/g.2758  ORF Transcript_1890/g.2758 Transcript_1890/m.2758 type:complete len:418 (+) Transcript_1890:244-1497(+)